MRRPQGTGRVPGGAHPAFDGFDVLALVDSWDVVTAGVVLARLGPLPPLRYFEPREEAVARPLLDLILDQHEEPRVPVFEMIDRRLAELSTDGWRYELLPPDPEAWSRSLQALGEDARDRHGVGFAECSVADRGKLLQSILDLGGDRWHGMPADQVWSLWSRYACTAFYSHPWAWNEIGFPGPAYPRGYKNLGIAALPSQRLRHPQRDGVGADWPIAYDDLEPYYEQIEGELPVAGEEWPWGDPHGYPHSPHPVGPNGQVLQIGAEKLGIETRVGPVAIANGRFGHRQHCIYRGYCLQGCKVNAKASPLITHVPDAIAHGAEIRPDSMVIRVEIDERTGRATGVHYFQQGVERFQRAAHVIVAGYSIETPRLLLHSTSRRFPDGLCNDHDLVGRYLMVQGAPQSGGRFAKEIRMYKAPPPEVSSEQFYETDPSRPYKRGFSIQTVSPLPITWAEHFAGQKMWGRELRKQMSDYVHWAVLGALCEFLPLPDNRVTLSDQKDRRGMPVARFSYTQCDNDHAQMDAAEQTMEEILLAAGAEHVTTFRRCAHLVGGARMGTHPSNGVVDGDCRTFAVPNLLVTDGSVLPTQGAANPALTIMAVAARAADRLVETS